MTSLHGIHEWASWGLGATCHRNISNSSLGLDSIILVSCCCFRFTHAYQQLCLCLACVTLPSAVYCSPQLLWGDFNTLFGDRPYRVRAWVYVPFVVVLSLGAHMGVYPNSWLISTHLCSRIYLHHTQRLDWGTIFGFYLLLHSFLWVMNCFKVCFIYDFYINCLCTYIGFHMQYTVASSVVDKILEVLWWIWIRLGHKCDIFTKKTW